MITAELLNYVLTEFGPMGMVLVYLFLRDRRMEGALLQLAEQTEGVERDKVEDRLNVRLGDD